MGKDLKGRELGTGLAQRKDGRYTARFVPERGIESQIVTLTRLRKHVTGYKTRNITTKRKSIVAPFDMVAKDIVSSNAELAA